MESPSRYRSTSLLRSLHSSCYSLLVLLLIILLSGTIPIPVVSLGINYGQIANNLPTPDKVVPLIKSIGATKVKLYDADPKVLKAFAKTGIEFTVTVGNDLLPQFAKDPKQAIDWVKKNVQCYLPDTNITCILIGNEVLGFDDKTLTSSLLPAMQNMHSALQSLDLDSNVWVTTAHNLAILETSYPPSAGAFKQDLSSLMSQILTFHAKTGSPFLINAYPYFAYKANPEEVNLDYVLFQAKTNQILVDPDSDLHYDNMLVAQVDAVYYAMGPNFNKKVLVQVSETGWPSKGDEDEIGATPENAKKYNGNLIKLVKAQNKGTPMKPNCDLNVFVFALFNENMKPGPTSERNYGLFKPDGTAAYSLGFSTIQAVGNASTSTDGATGPSSIGTFGGGGGDGSGGDGSSSNGYLSISFSTERYPSVGLSVTSLVVMVTLLVL
ncbi:glucan endo-1,3-beta-glucosidase 11 [Beta vulgaris subsp. vulgaris]|uniref:glucan endo-1,3-beta-glucosidase 11 n=1 Tax=Beta vulgaris subsp. vulgaris TaxID=3555 RepID=UPI0020366D13|nr:glucan endo-1,3-beta-glucosidase 11 [Beta vulgaris subsp. vulgaris]